VICIGPPSGDVDVLVSNDRRREPATGVPLGGEGVVGERVEGQRWLGGADEGALLFGEQAIEDVYGVRAMTRVDSRRIVAISSGDMSIPAAVCFSRSSSSGCRRTSTVFHVLP
jgi:hypothetical protein